MYLLTVAFYNSEAHKYFVEFISKAYQALTDPISRENFEKYGHPDGRQAMFHSLLRSQWQLASNFLLKFIKSSGNNNIETNVQVC